MKLVKGIKMPDFTYLSPYAEGPQSFETFAEGKKHMWYFCVTTAVQYAVWTCTSLHREWLNLQQKTAN